MSLENTPAARISALAAAQKTYFRSGATLSEAFRRTMLRRLDAALANWEKRLCDALWTDLHKSPKEAYLTEISIVRGEIRSHLRHLGKWMRPERRPSPLKLLPSKSRILSQPLGQALIVAPWNYPVQLLLNPLVGAISAGCTALLKPSPYTPNVAEVLERMIAEIFDEEYVAVAQGGREVNTLLFGMRWDVIFFTGSPALGRIVMTAAARNLTPVVLELGGKSPCIVHSDADVRRAAQRIAWGKGINTGQTCVAPQRAFVHRSVYREFLAMCTEIASGAQCGTLDEQANTGPLIDEAAVARMEQLVEDAVEKGARVACGGTRPADKTSGFYFLPTILTGVMPEMRVFREEVFGPVLALMSYDTEEEAIRMANDTEYGLSSYIWSTDLSQVYRLTRGLQFGIVNVNGPGTGPAVPHGGCKNSGIGKDGSRYSLEEYTYIKGIRMAIS